MDWLNLHTSTLDSPEVLGAEPVDRGTWLMLLRYCVGQENAGVIQNCRDWKDRRWQQTIRVTLEEIDRPSDLWKWHGNDIHVALYPLEKEAQVRNMRALGRSKTQAKANAAKANGKLGGRPPKTQRETQRGNPKETQPKTQKKPIEGKGREGNRKGKEVVEAAAATAEKLIAAHPRPSKNRDALEAALHALRIDDFETILTGTTAYAGAVLEWPPDERAVYTMTAAKFFQGHHWRDDPQDWTSRRAAKTRLNGHHPTIDIGGRKPAGVLDPANLPFLDDADLEPEPDFDAPLPKPTTKP